MLVGSDVPTLVLASMPNVTPPLLLRGGRWGEREQATFSLIHRVEKVNDLVVLPTGNRDKSALRFRLFRFSRR